MKLPEEQNRIFENLADSKHLLGLYSRLIKSQNVTDEWSAFSKEVYDILIDKKQLRSFLSNSARLQSFLFMNNMGTMMQQQIEFLEEVFSNQNDYNLDHLMKESKIGNPQFIYSSKYQTTHNTIHHLYHLARYVKQRSVDLRNTETVVEWGGGYGNMCRVVNNFATNLKTYVIFDLPVMVLLQYVYLSSVFGEDAVNICFDGKIVNGKINLLTFEMFDETQDFKTDLFLSTWALSESPISYHDNIVNKLNWFGADKLLLAFHQCGIHIPFMKESTNIGMLAKKSGAHIKNVQIIPGTNLYAFK